MRFTHFLAISLCGIANVACQMDEIEVPREELFTRAFIKEFGIPDPDQDWNVATRVTANVDPALVRGAETICVYDCMPGGPDCQLAARFSASTTSFDFDFAKGNTRAYIQATDAKGTVVASGYYPIENGVLKVANRTSRAGETTACTIKAKDISTYDEITSGFSSNINKRFSIYGMYDSSKGSDWVCWGTPEAGHPDFRNNKNTDVQNCYLGPTFSAIDDGRTVADLSKIVGPNGVFHEGADKTTGQCNLERYAEKLNPAAGVTYKPAVDGTKISIEYIYGSACFNNSLGYFYYKEGASNDEILKSPMFLMAFDASPWNNTKRSFNKEDYFDFSEMNGTDTEGTKGNWDLAYWINRAGMLPANDIEMYQNEGTTRYKPSTYNLVYYPMGEDGKPKVDEGRYEFPADVRIGFFIICQGYPKMISKGSKYGQEYKVGKEDFRFSIPALNRELGNSFKQNHLSGKYLHNDNRFTDADNPMWFVTYNWNQEVVMGVEDGTYDNCDHDMNDILFFVHGVEPPPTEDLGEDPVPESWIVACEDLGSFHDFDFNDVVFGLSYFATDKNEDRCLKVKALAAGGTLPVQLMWTAPNGKQHDLGAENGYPRWNNWFGVSNENQVVNCNHNRDYRFDGATVTIDLKEFPDYSISPNSYLNEGEKYPMGGFSIGVYEDGGYKFTREVKPLGQYQEGDETWSKTPQMILLHRTWRWPIENKPIFDAYSGGAVTGSDKYVKQAGFRDWIKDKYNIEWTSLPSDTEVVVEHNWNGEKFTSGSKQ